MWEVRLLHDCTKTAFGAVFTLREEMLVGMSPISELDSHLSCLFDNPSFLCVVQ